MGEGIAVVPALGLRQAHQITSHAGHWVPFGHLHAGVLSGGMGFDGLVSAPSAPILTTSKFASVVSLTAPFTLCLRHGLQARSSAQSYSIHINPDRSLVRYQGPASRRASPSLNHHTRAAPARCASLSNGALHGELGRRRSGPYRTLQLPKTRAARPPRMRPPRL